MVCLFFTDGVSTSDVFGSDHDSDNNDSDDNGDGDGDGEMNKSMTTMMTKTTTTRSKQKRAKKTNIPRTTVEHKEEKNNGGRNESDHEKILADSTTATGGEGEAKEGTD
jgi:hypothetical protein